MVSYITSTLVCTLAIVMCFRFLRLLAFTINQSIAGACSLLFGTTFLHCTQNLQENNLLLLLTLTGFYFQYDWLKNRCTRSLLWGSLAFGANLLTRLTTCMDILAAALFVFLCAWGENNGRRARLDRLIEYGRICIPCYLVFFIIDRLYQYHRFGSLFNTYLTIYGKQFAGKWPGTTEPDWLWRTPFWKGFLGPLITPEKSVFLFDPLIVLTLVLTFFLWRRFASDMKAYVFALFWLLLAYIVFYARYYDWSGDAAWGDRFVTTPVQMLALASIPLLMRYRVTLGSWAWNVGKAIAATSVIIQIASVFFNHLLELTQIETLKRTIFIIGLRFVNIIAFAIGKTDRWGLGNQHIRSWLLNTPDFFPILVMRRGSASGWKLDILIATWMFWLAALAASLFLISTKIRHSEECT